MTLFGRSSADRPRSSIFAAIALLISIGLTSCSSSSTPAASTTPTPTTPTTPAMETVPVTGMVKHVFVVVLENKTFSTTFGSTSPVPYLTQTLAGQGAQLSGYYGTGHVSLDNYISMLSGQAGSPQTITDCATYADFTQTSTTLAANSQALGSGCVYPASVQTLADQLTAANLTWKGYMGDMGNDPARESGTCGHPTLNTTDLTQTAEAPSSAVPLGDMYATRHDPFMYFHSIIDSPVCQTNVVNMQNNLANDLKSVFTTANFNFITPNLCDDGHDSPCANGQPGGYTSINAFLTQWIPMIMASPAYQADGLLIINFDESNYTLSTSPVGGAVITFPGYFCCNQQLGPNLSAYPQSQTITVAGGPSETINYNNYGGDNTGAILLSPFIKSGTVSATPYNHYSMLRTIEDIFGLSHLGNAQTDGLVPLGTDVFTNVQ
jgi:phosphatidylinositol-3-phosphatase